MKKSLVALAVLAASGAVLAQVTVKGNLTAGFSQTQLPTGVTAASGAGVTSGFGVDTADITFAATEDLGGGMKAGASLGLVNVVRGATPATVAPGNSGVLGFGPANTSVYVSGDFGKVTISTARATDYLTGGVAFVGGTFQDGRVLSDRPISDSIAWSTTFGPVALSITHAEPDNVVGLGTGTSGASSATDTLQSSTALGLRYTDGPLIADFGYALYDEGSTPANLGDKTDTRFAGAYDFGAFKLGGGWRQRTGKTGDRTDMGLSAAVPMGALTLGANWVQRSIGGGYIGQKTSNITTGAANTVAVGYGLSANYALSKRTSFIADYTAFTRNSNTTNGTNTEFTNIYNLFLSHSF